MSFGIAVRTLDAAGGAQTANLQNFFKVEGQAVATLGSKVLPHPAAPPHTLGPPMVEGSPWFLIDGIPACRRGHAAACGHTTTGRPWFLLSE